MPSATRLVFAAMLGLALAGASPSSAAQAQGPPPLHEYCFDGDVPQRASADDLHVFDPFIGRFRGVTQRDEASGRDHFFTVEFAWFGAGQQIVRYTVARTVVGEPDEFILNEGYYGHNPFTEHLYVLGAFASGISGFGAVGEFDRAAHLKSTWACQTDAAGARVYVRDRLQSIDADSWRNVTRVRQGATGDWVIVTDEGMTRIP